MEESESKIAYTIKLGQIRSNLKQWNPFEWVIFWLVIPAVLFVVYSLPQGIKDAYFILDTSHLWRVQTFLLSSYTHSQFYPHLVGNLAFYFVVLLMIFLFEKNKRRFRILAGWSFLVVPVITSTLTIALWWVFGRSTTGQGFSAIVGALLAYAMFIFVVWGTQDKSEIFDSPELFSGTKARYLILRSLLSIIVFLIVIMGILFGIFTDAGGSLTNGIAHFGGFITSLVVLLVIDLRTEKRRYFDSILGMAILTGILLYGYYLAQVIRFVKSL
jgi:membrane associated rhomboid family serine protease